MKERIGEGINGEIKRGFILFSPSSSSCSVTSRRQAWVNKPQLVVNSDLTSTGSVWRITSILQFLLKQFSSLPTLSRDLKWGERAEEKEEEEDNFFFLARNCLSRREKVSGPSRPLRGIPRQISKGKNISCQKT